MKRSVSKNTNHIVLQAPSLSPSALKRTLLYLLESGFAAPVFVVVLMIAYATLLRQSNLILPAVGASPRHILLFSHVKSAPGALEITVSSTKTRFLSDPPLIFVIPALPSSPLCPVKAWNKYLATVTPSNSDPAFLLPSRTPLTAPLLTKVLRLALKETGTTDYANYTLHSLRRGAARACVALGIPEEEVKKAGTWTSNAISTYVPRAVITRVPAALANLFG